jgi:pimeloyl-ACP methyl ester carboxylesterase
MPLVPADAESPAPARSDAHERARKIRPEYARGDLVRVAGGRNQAEAELIQNMLLEEGVPSILRRTAGFDVPDFLAAGPRDVMVPASGVQAAAETLTGTGLEPTPYEPPRLVRQALLILTVLVLVGGGTAVIVWATLPH